MKKTTLYLPDSLHQEAHVLAARQRQSLTAIVRVLLRNWLKDQWLREQARQGKG